MRVEVEAVFVQGVENLDPVLANLNREAGPISTSTPPTDISPRPIYTALNRPPSDGFNWSMSFSTQRTIDPAVENGLDSSLVIQRSSNFVHATETIFPPLYSRMGRSLQGSQVPSSNCSSAVSNLVRTWCNMGANAALIASIFSSNRECIGMASLPGWTRRLQVVGYVGLADTLCTLKVRHPPPARYLATSPTRGEVIMRSLLFGALRSASAARRG